MAGGLAMARAVVVSAPAGIRRVLLENTDNYRKDARRMPDQARHSGGHRALRAASASPPVGSARHLRSQSLPRRRLRQERSLCLPAVRRGATHLHRLGLRAAGSNAGAGHDPRQFRAGAGRRPRGLATAARDPEAARRIAHGDQTQTANCADTALSGVPLGGAGIPGRTAKQTGCGLRATQGRVSDQLRNFVLPMLSISPYAACCLSGIVRGNDLPCTGAMGARGGRGSSQGAARHIGNPAVCTVATAADACISALARGRDGWCLNQSHGERNQARWLDVPVRSSSGIQLIGLDLSDRTILFDGRRQIHNTSGR